jgi:hypothetical protein
MNNSHDEIKKLLKQSRTLLESNIDKIEKEHIKNSYGLLSEQDITKKYNVTKAVEDEIEDNIEDEDDELYGEKSKKDKKQGYRISGNVIVLHGKENNELELTGDEKNAFQETINEFNEFVSEMGEFNKLNVYPKNVEWSGKVLDFDIEFFFSIGEQNGVYIKGDMIRTDDQFLDFVNKLKKFYDQFKAKWSKVLATRKRMRKYE